MGDIYPGAQSAAGSEIVLRTLCRLTGILAEGGYDYEKKAGAIDFIR